MSPVTEIIDHNLVKTEVVQYIGSVIEDARLLAVSIVDDESCARAADLGVQVKDRIKWLKERRKAVYDPLKEATETVRLEFDNPLKLGDQIERTLAAAVIDYRQKKRDEERKRQLEAEAEARRQREEAARKEREAAAERDRIIRERELEEARKRQAVRDEERRKEEALAEEKRQAEARAKAEADARARQIKEEEDRRIAAAQKAHDVGLADRSEQIIDKQMPVAPLPAPLPSTAELAAKADQDRQAREARVADEKRKTEEKAAEERKRQEEADLLKRMDEEAAVAKAKAAEMEAVAASQVTVARPDERMRTSVSWKWDIKDAEAFKKLCRAVAEGRAPVEYAGFDPEQPQKFRAAAITKDVTRLKDQFQGDAIGIRTWFEESGTFKAGA